MSTANRDSTDVFVGGLENLFGEFTANGSINALDLVELSGDNEVQQASTDGTGGLGVALYDVSDGEAVAVALPPAVVRVNSTDSVTAGDIVTSHGGTTAGRVDTASATGDETVGKAFTGGSSNEAVVLLAGPAGEIN